MGIQITIKKGHIMTEEIAVYETGQASLSPFGSVEGFEACMRMAKALAASTFIPKEFKNNIGDCLIMLETSSRTNMPIMALMQNTYVIHGRPSFSASFMAGLINNSNRFDAPLRFKYNDERTACYAYATANGEEYKSIVVSMEMADKEGWTKKAGSKWLTMPEVMLQYRAISFFARAYCADLIMGMRSVDEEVERGYQGTAAPAADLDTLNNKLDDEIIDVSTGEVSEPEPEKHTRTRPAVIEAMKNEINKIDNSQHLDRWRQKHQGRIARELPKEDDQNVVFVYAEDVFQELKRSEQEQRNDPPMPGDLKL